MNQKMDQNQVVCPSNHFNVLNADGDNYAYIPVKNTSEKKNVFFAYRTTIFRH